MPKPYARLSLTEDELATVLGAMNASRASVFEKFGATPGGPEKEFYAKRVDVLDALIEKLERPRRDDKSQDANEEADPAPGSGEDE